jgi:MFS family permease
MFAPGIKQIADDLDATENGIIACQTGFVVMLGVGPLVLAPLSETFGRKALYLVCFSVFTLLQIPTALATSLPTLVFLRTLTGFFGSMLHIIDAISSIDR